MAAIENTKALHERARIIHSEIAQIRELADSQDADPEALLTPLYRLLDQIYTEELPLARILDSSDLVTRFGGPAVDTSMPRVQVVSSAFISLRSHVQSLAKAVLGLTASPDSRPLRFPKTFDLELAGLARGSLVIGIRIPEPGEVSPGTTRTLFAPEDEPLYQAVRGAVRGLSTIANFVTDEGFDAEGLEEEVDDPAIRDAMVSAAFKLSPSGRTGIESVSFRSTETEPEAIRSLTPQSRRELRKVVKRPIQDRDVRERVKVIGTVREIDLDANRFEVRNIGPNRLSVRCFYPNELEKTVRKFLDQDVEISGPAVFKGAVPRFMEMERHQILKEPTQEDWVKI